MPFLQLDLKSLNDIDEGRVGIAFVQELKRIVLDCMDRPKDKGKRKVAIMCEVVPVLGEGQILECEGAEASFKIKSVVPERKSKTYSFRVNKAGQLSFSQNSPENPDQTTIFDPRDEQGRVDRGSE